MSYLISPIEFNVPFELSRYLPYPPYSIEIGFGNGSFLIELAQKQKNYSYLGIELSSRAVFKAIKKLDRLNLPNVRVIKMDAFLLFAATPPGSVDRVIFNFPDPWPDRPEKRFTHPFNLNLIKRALKPTGKFYVATDDTQLQEEIKSIPSEVFKVNYKSENFFGIKTKYEKRWEEMGKRILYFELSPSNNEYEIIYQIIGGKEMAHAILRKRFELPLSLKLPYPMRKNLKDKEIFFMIDEPFKRRNEYLFPVIVREKLASQRFFIKLIEEPELVRIKADDTSYLVFTKGVMLAFEFLLQNLIEKNLHVEILKKTF